MVTHTIRSSPARQTNIDDDALPLLDDRALECAQRLLTWAGEHAAAYDLELVEARVRRCQSLEDTEWLEAVLDLTVEGADSAVQGFWEAAALALDQLAGPHSPVPVESLWVRVRQR